MPRNKVAIIGFGYVGKAMYKIFPDAVIYDNRFFGEDGLPTKEGFEVQDETNVMLATKEFINNNCELAIICVPTPMDETENEFAPVDTSIVSYILTWLDGPLVLIKSTVPPGTTDAYNIALKTIDRPQNVCFSPEYVGEGKYQITPWKYMSPEDPRTHEFVIIGGPEEARERIAEIFVKRLGPEKFYYLVEAIEAEVIKYMENSWGAMKVIFAQEFHELCQKLGASYIKVREGWALDNRVERMHTAVFVDDKGFSGKCYPKDLNGIVAKGDEVGADMSLIKAVLRKNKQIKDRYQDV